MIFIHDIIQNKLINIDNVIEIGITKGGHKGENVNYIVLIMSNNKRYKLPMTIDEFKKTVTASNVGKFINIDIEDDVDL
jgi:hypothetical protein